MNPDSAEGSSNGIVLVFTILQDDISYIPGDDSSLLAKNQYRRRFPAGSGFKSGVINCSCEYF